MFSILGDLITLTRGDSLSLSVEITEDGDAYIPEEGDVISFALRSPEIVNGEYTGAILISKTIPNDTQLLTLSSTDTATLPFGHYVYEVSLNKADGTSDTFIPAAPFILTPEVGRTVSSSGVG